MVPPVSLVKGARLWREEPTPCRAAALWWYWHGVGWGGNWHVADTSPQLPRYWHFWAVEDCGRL